MLINSPPQSAPRLVYQHCLFCMLIIAFYSVSHVPTMNHRFPRRRLRVRVYLSRLHRNAGAPSSKLERRSSPRGVLGASDSEPVPNHISFRAFLVQARCVRGGVAFPNLAYKLGRWSAGENYVAKSVCVRCAFACVQLCDARITTLRTVTVYKMRLSRLSRGASCA